MTTLSAEEALAQDVSVLGNTYGTRYYFACQELWNVAAHWDRYEALFASSERIELLNASSGAFWHAMQTMIHEHVLLGLCRLTDPARMGRNTNLSMASLYDADPTLDKEGLNELVERAFVATQFARTWRDKRIAHNDLAHSVGDASDIEISNKEKVRSAIVAIHDVLRWIQARYFGGELYLTDQGDDDVDELMVALARAKWVQDEEAADLAAKRYDRLLEPRYKYPGNDRVWRERYSLQSATPLPRAYQGAIPLET